MFSSRFLVNLLVVLASFLHSFPVPAQEEARAAWQPTKFDLKANIVAAERTLNGIALLSVKNAGRGSGSSITLRINSRANIRSISVNGANVTFRSLPENSGGLQRVLVNFPGAVAPNATVNLTVDYRLPVESNSKLASISPLITQFLPRSFWYPLPNAPFTARGSDTAPFRLEVNSANTISSGIQKGLEGGSSVFEQSLFTQPFFLEGDWERIDGKGDNKGVTAYLPQGASAAERKQAEALINLASGARSYLGAMLGPAPDTPIRIVAVRRGSGFNDGGTILLETGAFRRARIDAFSALQIAEAVARLWLGGQTPIRGEGSGVLREGLARFLATLFVEKQFGQEAAEAERLRERLAYADISKRDAPLSRSVPTDETYYIPVSNKGAMVWRLADQRLGREQFTNVVRSLLQTGKAEPAEISLSEFRAALAERGGAGLKALLDQELDQVTDMDLMAGLPSQRAGQWVSALRNLGSIDAAVNVVATTDRGEQLSVEKTVPAHGFSEAEFKTTSRVVRVEIDPQKFYPQIDYSNDVVPKLVTVSDGVADASRAFGAEDYVKAEAIARQLMAAAPGMQEARIMLARALLGQNKLEEAEKLFRSSLEDALPTTATIAWANAGLAEISLRRGQPSAAVELFTTAVRADAEYAVTLAARLGRIKAEAASTNSVSHVDEAARAFIAQFDQAITSGKKVELEQKIASGELVRFISGIVGSQPEIWQTRVLRTESLSGNLLAADVSIKAKELGREQSGPAVLILANIGGAWKLDGIELFEVR